MVRFRVPVYHGSKDRSDVPVSLCGLTQVYMPQGQWAANSASLQEAALAMELRIPCSRDRNEVAALRRCVAWRWCARLRVDWRVQRDCMNSSWRRIHGMWQVQSLMGGHGLDIDRQSWPPAFAHAPIISRTQHDKQALTSALLHGAWYSRCLAVRVAGVWFSCYRTWQPPHAASRTPCASSVWDCMLQLPLRTLSACAVKTWQR